MENCNNYSFRRGWFQLRQRDVAAVRSKRKGKYKL